MPVSGAGSRRRRCGAGEVALEARLHRDQILLLRKAPLRVISRAHPSERLTASLVGLIAALQYSEERAPRRGRED